MVDAWPAAPEENEYSQVRRSNVETLLVGGELDFSTPPQIMTKELLPYLPNGQQVVLPGIGHTGTFFAVQPEASSRSTWRGPAPLMIGLPPTRFRTRSRRPPSRRHPPALE
jgi:hypothetical protein